MKNDNYLERIAIALETLVAQGNSLSADFSEPTQTEAPVKKEVTPVAVEYAKPTHDDLKQACLTSARADSENRAKLKALLKEYGAVKAADVAEEKLAEVIARINKGDF